RGSTTTPFTSGERWGTKREYTKGRLSSVEGPLGEYDGALFCDSDGVLKVGGQGAVGGADRPAVRLHVDVGRAGVHHRLDRQRHPGLEPGQVALAAEVRDLGVLVHLAPDPVADELADDREAGRLDVLLDRGRDVPQVAAWTGIVDSY